MKLNKCKNRSRAKLWRFINKNSHMFVGSSGKYKINKTNRLNDIRIIEVPHLRQFAEFVIL